MLGRRRAEALDAVESRGDDPDGGRRPRAGTTIGVRSIRCRRWRARAPARETWLHGSTSRYGGGLLLGPRRAAAPGHRGPDSVTLDLHKLGWQP